MSNPVLFQCPRRELGMVEQLHQEYALYSFKTPEGWAPEILDVGAHVGSFAIHALRRWPAGRCTSYEPHPETYRLLENNTHGLVCRTRNAAVVHPKTTEKVRLYEGVESEGRHACSIRDDVVWDAHTPQQHVSQQLDRWLEVDAVAAEDLEPCDVMKADTEGNEIPILRGYCHLHGVQILLVECHAVIGDLQGQMRTVVSIAQGAGLQLVGQAGTVLRFCR